MKKLTLIIIILLSITACKKDKNSFTLSGNISGLENDTLYIYEQEGSENNLDTIIAKKGSFEYTLKVDTITPLTIVINNTAEHAIYADKGLNTTIKGEATALTELDIVGGELNNELNEFRKSIVPFMKSETEIAKRAEGFIRSHPQSPVSIHLINKYFAQKATPDYTKIDTLINSLSGSLRDNVLIKRLSEIISLQNSVAIGKYAPPFSNKNKDGKEITLYDFKDNYLLIYFWASWWNRYPTENTTMKTIREKFKKEKLALLGVSLDVDRKSWLEAIKKDTISGIQVTDLNGWDNTIVKQYAIEELPSNILISPERKIIGKNLNEQKLIQKLEELFK